MAWPEELLAQVDGEATRRNMNRSEFVRWCVSTVLTEQHFIDVVPLPDQPAVLGLAAPHRR